MNQWTGQAIFSTQILAKTPEVCTWVHFYNRRFSIESNWFPAPQLWRKVTDRSFAFCNSLAASHGAVMAAKALAILGHGWRWFQGTAMSCANWIRQSRCKVSWRLWIIWFICHFGTNSTRTQWSMLFTCYCWCSCQKCGLFLEDMELQIWSKLVLKRSFFSGESLRVGNCTFLSCQVSNMLDTWWKILIPRAILALDPDTLHSFGAQDIELFMNESWVSWVHGWTAKSCHFRSIPSGIFWVLPALLQRGMIRRPNC